MRPLLASLTLLLAALSPAAQARDVDLSLSLGFAQPGLVGRVDIGRPYGAYGYASPVYLAPQPVYLAPQPVYVVPHYPSRKRGHAKHWRRDCYRYGDCGYAHHGRYERDEYDAPRHYRYGAPVVVIRD